MYWVMKLGRYTGLGYWAVQTAPSIRQMRCALHGLLDEMLFETLRVGSASYLSMAIDLIDSGHALSLHHLTDRNLLRSKSWWGWY